MARVSAGSRSLLDSHRCPLFPHLFASSALYLTSLNMGLLLAGMSKATIGTSMRHIGASFSRHHSNTARQGAEGAIQAHYDNGMRSSCQGLLTHCWFLVGMDPALMNNLHDPLTYAKKLYKGPDHKLSAATFPDLSATTWPAWQPMYTHSTTT